MAKGSDSKPLDLIVRNGALVIPGVGQIKADVGIAGDKVAVIGNNLNDAGAESYDATGRTVLPGIFDPHIHIGNEQSYESEGEFETRGGDSRLRYQRRSLPEQPKGLLFRSPPCISQGDGRGGRGLVLSKDQ